MPPPESRAALPSRLVAAESRVIALGSGASARVTDESGFRAVVCLNGGSARERPGDWSATLEYLVRRLAPCFPDLSFVELRYRIKSWKRLDFCIEDGLAALEAVASRGARECVLLGFSMGGAVAISVAGHPAVSAVIGLAPWIPPELDVSGLHGKRLTVVHGRLDGVLPGIPGVQPGKTLRGLERIREQGVEVNHTLIPAGLHGVAIRAPWGGLLPLPRAGRWVELVSAELEAFRMPG